MMNKKWEFKTHSYQIADTGDYDGHYELTNGEISLITKDEPGVEWIREYDPINMVVGLLNTIDVKWVDTSADATDYELSIVKSTTARLELLLHNMGVPDELVEKIRTTWVVEPSDVTEAIGSVINKHFLNPKV